MANLLNLADRVKEFLGKAKQSYGQMATKAQNVMQAPYKQAYQAVAPKVQQAYQQGWVQPNQQRMNTISNVRSPLAFTAQEGFFVTKPKSQLTQADYPKLGEFTDPKSLFGGKTGKGTMSMLGLGIGAGMPTFAGNIKPVPKPPGTSYLKGFIKNVPKSVATLTALKTAETGLGEGRLPTKKEFGEAVATGIGIAFFLPTPLPSASSIELTAARKTLGVKPNATEAELKTAMFEKNRPYLTNPPKTGTPEWNKQVEITKAFEVATSAKPPMGLNLTAFKDWLNNLWKKEEKPSKTALITQKPGTPGVATTPLSPILSVGESGGLAKGVGGVVEVTAYHGSDVPIEKFDISKIGSNTDSGMLGEGVYFSGSAKEASSYARKTGSVGEYSLSLKNPYTINSKSDIPNIKASGTKDYSQKFTKYLKDRGYDGVIDNISPNKQYVVFSPDQINLKNATRQATPRIVEPVRPLSNKGVGAKPTSSPTKPQPVGGVRSLQTQLPSQLPSQPARVKGTFQDHFSKLIADKELAKTVATQKSTKSAKIPSNIAREVIDVREGVTKSTNKEVNKHAAVLKKEFDTAYTEAKTALNDAGLKIGYLENYTPHFWKESSEEVQAAFLKVRKSFKSAKARTIPTYKEGIDLGFTPRYAHPAEMHEAYISNLEQFKSSVNFFNKLKSDGIISSVRKDGLVNITAEGLGGNWYAPANVAEQISKVFNPPDQGQLSQFLGKSAKVSGAIQDIALSGGVPGTPVNAFTIAQAQKDMLSGRIKSPIRAMVTSISPKKTSQFFEKNVGQIKKMQERNVTIRSSYNVSELLDTKLTNKIFGGGAKQAWTKLVNEPTFGRFMPMLQINLFNDIESKALKNGLSKVKSVDMASDAVSNFYGLTNTAKQAMRDKQLADLGTTALFAPRYRESMVNFWVNTVKGMKNPLSQKNITNSKFAIGAVMTYLVMDQINRAKNGHGMQDNPSWKKDKLLIPMDDGHTLGIPYLSSIATIPRGMARIGEYLSKGDVAGASTETFRTFASMGLKPLGEISANEDYFGRPIYEDADTPGEKLLKQASHIFKSVNHPYVREFVEMYTKPDKPLAQRLSMAMELPFRFYKTEGIENAPFWEKYHELKIVSDKYAEMKKSKSPEAEAYLLDNEVGINEFNLLRGYMTEYFDEIDSQGESDILKNAPAFLRGVNPALIKEDKKFEVSDDAPKTKRDKAGLYLKSGLVDLGGTLESVYSKEPPRKIRGGELVTERRTDISGIDVGKKGVQVDHRIPKWAGGRDVVKNYQALSDEDHKAKSSFEAGLRAKVERGDMTQEKARKEIEKWHKDNKIKPVSLTKGEIGVVEKEVKKKTTKKKLAKGNKVTIKKLAKGNKVTIKKLSAPARIKTTLKFAKASKAPAIKKARIAGVDKRKLPTYNL